MFQIISRQTGEVRVIVCDTANQATCQGLLCQLLPPGSTLYSDELSGYAGWPEHFSVCHSQKEYARDADGDGIREVHCNTCEGAHSALRTFLRRFQGVHKVYLACYLTVYEAVRNAKRITSEIIRRFCFGKRLHARRSCGCAAHYRNEKGALYSTRTPVLAIKVDFRLVPRA